MQIIKPKHRGKADTAIIVIVIALSVVAILAVVACLGTALLLPAVQGAREAARRTQCRNNLKQIGIALHNYHDAYGAFPPAVVTDENGKPMHSWRVLLLPFVNEQAIYQLYDFTVPWDDPANQAVLTMVPDVYKCPTGAEAGSTSYTTSYMAIVGDNTVMRAESSVSMKEITNGTSNTAVIAEVIGAGVEWTNPVDLPAGSATSTGTPGGISSKHPGVSNVLNADGAVIAVTSGSSVSVEAAPAAPINPQ